MSVCPVCAGRKLMTVHPPHRVTRTLIACPLCSLDDDTLRILAYVEGIHP